MIEAAAGICYLALPYTDPDPAVRATRYEAANRAAAELIASGRIVFSPITLTHPIDIEMAGEGATLGSDYWVRFDEAFMDICSDMVILPLPGWENSRGVAREAVFFISRGRPVRMFDAYLAEFPPLKQGERAPLEARKTDDLTLADHSR